MSKLVVLSFLAGNFEEGFFATLEIGEDDRVTQKTSGRLPPDPQISTSLTRWQNDFRKKVDRGYKTESTECRNASGIQPRKAQDSRCQESAKQLAADLNNWLNSAEKDWQKIRDRLQQQLNTTETEIRVIIQTQNTQMRQLPWSEWDLFAKFDRNAEIALSPTEYELPNRNNRPVGSKVRILAVLGHSDNIDTQFDRRLIEGLRDRRADITILEQPSKKKLLEFLGHEQGWHIFFFAGHSSTTENGQIGKFDINQRESLAIDELKNTLRWAIGNGLQLVIFNSCDGLGLANQLANLQLPQSIVMREIVPDQIAQDFLQHFLDYFSQNTSFYTSVLFARRKLEDQWNKQYPGASWLPVICQNPAVPPPTWRGLIGNPEPTWECLHTLTKHSGIVQAVAISPDGKTLASGSNDTTIKLWNLDTGELLETLTGHTSAVLSLGFSPDRKILVSSSNLEFNDGTIKIWDLKKLQLKQTLENSWLAMRVCSVAFSPDGQYLATGHLSVTLLGTPIKIWDLNRGKVRCSLKGHGWDATSVAFSSDGQILVTGSNDGSIMIWDWRREQRLRTFNRPNGFVNSLVSWFDSSVESIWSIAISPDNKIIASGGSEGLVILWDINSGKRLHVLTKHSGAVYAVAFSPDGQTLASGSRDSTIRIWNCETGQLLQTLKHLGPVKSLAFSPDGQTLVSGSEDSTVKVWRLFS
jgi:WD40 repeat protein